MFLFLNNSYLYNFASDIVKINKVQFVLHTVEDLQSIVNTTRWSSSSTHLWNNVGLESNQLFISLLLPDSSLHPHAMVEYLSFYKNWKGSEFLSETADSIPCKSTKMKPHTFVIIKIFEKSKSFLIVSQAYTYHSLRLRMKDLDVKLLSKYT